ncbi:bacteriohopanetetrol glucosamine biosynthesis glycosyltransferase HpnI [Paraburkholderia rhizosphaerae]|uniref:Ceramide glucosyltransferase n=1 Tax=Paraburkholderia rhizosphaerae TaxID=480658 RepID=A0A4V6QD67_9BURK|nr:bacteriohopanetetrol glucosamine biosynthesis glycosyltransferase HpnI [Paraburkholderia rhizosphaerae]TDY53949.1 ceramide glucosyltransferase [Paraburkholderia rhizosphaerae]
MNWTTYAQWLLAAICCGATAYVASAAGLMRRSNSAGRRAANARPQPAPAPLGAVSVLKPLCGAEPRLYENLATFCEQTHPCFQLLFGVSSAQDPAIGVVRRLQAAYPHCDITLVVDSRVHGSNLKVSNLINLAEHSRYEMMVIADSDIAVAPDYLLQVCAPLADPQAGVVTCLYRATGITGFWSRVGALFVNQWFLPSVLVAHATGSREFGFGATLALRREIFERIGGFMPLKDCLADDFWLTEHVRRLGLHTILSKVIVATDVIENGFAALWQRETRWLRTIRSVNPAGFAFLFITFTSPWLLLGAQLANAFHAEGGRPVASIAMTAVTLAGTVARLLMHAYATRGFRAFWRDLPLVPLRDTLLMLQWLAGAFGSHVIWRGARVPVAARAAASGATELDTVKVLEVSDGR